MDQELPSQLYTGGGRRWGEEQARASHIRSPSGLGARTVPVSSLHQRPCLGPRLHHVPLCRWHYCIPHYWQPCRRNVSATRPRQACWLGEMLAEFHPEKCQVLRVTKKTKASTICHDYVLHGHTLEVVDNVKYLGVAISGNLKWDVHVSHITNKANSTLAVLKRNVRVSSKSLKTAAYKALVRPHIEYCSTVWHPPTARLDHSQGGDGAASLSQRGMQLVQHRLKHHWSHRDDQNPWLAITSVPSKSRPPLPTLQNEKQPCPYILPPLREPYPYRTKIIAHHALIPLDKIPRKLYFATTQFLPRTVCDWNSLPHSVAIAPSIEAFNASVMSVMA